MEMIATSRLKHAEKNVGQADDCKLADEQQQQKTGLLL